MSNLILFVIKVLIVSGLLYGYYYLFLRNKKFHQYNRFYILVTFLLSMVIPFLHIPVSFLKDTESTAYKTLMVIYGSGEDEVILQNQHSFLGSLLNWQNAGWFIYGAVAAFILCRLLIGIGHIYQLRKKYPVEKVDDFYLLSTNEPGAPFSFLNLLFWNNRIDMQSTEGHKIFRHEVFHIRQKHTLDILFAEFFTLLVWFNPFFYLLKKELKAIHEFLADQFAIANSDNHDYAELLVMQALKTKQSLVHPFFHNQIKRRIAMITSSNKTSYQYLRKIMVLPVAALLIITFAFTIKKNEPANTLLAKQLTVVIDAGHGGDDNGAYALDGSFEKDYNLSIARMIAGLNNDPNLKIILTRNEDKSILLKDRSSFINQQNADLFLSIHCSATDKTDATATNGMEVFISLKNQTHEDQNKSIASILLNQFSDIHTTNNIIKKPKTGVWVLDQSNAPSALIECGFISNKTDLGFLKNKVNQQKIAKAILASIKIFGNNLTGNEIISQPTKAIPDTSIKNALIVIDDIIQQDMTADDLSKKTNSDDIASMNVLKGEAAIKKYGQKGKDGVIEIITKKSKEFKNPLIVIDGIEKNNVTMAEVNKKYPASSIAALNVIKNETAIKKYGTKAKDGVIEITTKNAVAPVSPLIVIDDVEQEGMTTGELDTKIRPAAIESINVLKNEAAIKKYGSKGKDGVIEIITKDTTSKTKN